VGKDDGKAGAEDPLAVDDAYTLWPADRAEAVNRANTLDITHQLADGCPAVQLAALFLSNNLRSRLAAW
jgi:hypothetical protein